MKKVLFGILLASLTSSLAFAAYGRLANKADAKLAHMVFFKLKDGSKEGVEKFVASCEKYLSGHDGAVYFSVGTRADDVDEPVSVKDFDVALHVVFETKAAKLKYLENSRHHDFVEENRPAFDKVRVFDSYLLK